MNPNLNNKNHRNKFSICIKDLVFVLGKIMAPGLIFRPPAQDAVIPAFPRKSSGSKGVEPQLPSSCCVNQSQPHKNMRTEGKKSNFNTNSPMFTFVFETKSCFVAQAGGHYVVQAATYDPYFSTPRTLDPVLLVLIKHTTLA